MMRFRESPKILTEGWNLTGKIPRVAARMAVRAAMLAAETAASVEERFLGFLAPNPPPVGVSAVKTTVEVHKPETHVPIPLRQGIEMPADRRLLGIIEIIKDSPPGLPISSRHISKELNGRGIKATTAETTALLRGNQPEIEAFAQPRPDEMKCCWVEFGGGFAMAPVVTAQETGIYNSQSE